MSSDAELVLLFGVLHLVAIGFGVLLFIMFLRSESAPAWRPDADDDDGGGGGSPVPRPDPVGPRGDGVPLPDAEQSRFRFRGPGRLADRFDTPSRRRVHDPIPQPVRSPHRAP